VYVVVDYGTGHSSARGRPPRYLVHCQITLLIGNPTISREIQVGVSWYRARATSDVLSSGPGVLRSTQIPFGFRGEIDLQVCIGGAGRKYTRLAHAM